MRLKIFIFLFLAFFANTVDAQLKKPFKFSTFYIAANGGTSLADENTTNNAQLSCAIHTIADGSFKISIMHSDATGATSATASKIHFLVINNS